MKWKVGDLVDWDGTYPSGSIETPVTPRFRGRITGVLLRGYLVDWPGNKNCFHWKQGSASRFTRSVLDTFEMDGEE
jgi:hypothetical protein